jgi:hypothetical protein
MVSAIPVVMVASWVLFQTVLLVMLELLFVLLELQNIMEVVTVVAAELCTIILNAKLFLVVLVMVFGQVLVQLLAMYQLLRQGIVHLQTVRTQIIPVLMLGQDTVGLTHLEMYVLLLVHQAELQLE